MNREYVMNRQLLDAFLKECDEDYVGLWNLVWELKRAGSTQSAADLRKATLTLVGELLNAGMVAGQFDRGVFHAWNAPPAEIVKRIDQEWDALDHDEPTLGDIVCLTSPTMLSAA